MELKNKDLIEFLKTLDPELPVAYALCSEYCLLELEDIEVKKLAPARPDGWVPRSRDNNGPHKDYLVFPGN